MNATPPPRHDQPAPAAVSPTRPARRLLRWMVWLLLLGAAGAGGWVWWQQRAQTQTAAPAARPGRQGGTPVPVSVAAAERQDIPVMLDALGTVQAHATITVRAQVDGQLTEIAFQEGQEVQQGDLLARIDPRSYQAALDQAVAKRAQNEALLANARLDLQRYIALARSEGASRQQQDTQRALVAQYEAQLQADQAAIDAARTQLSYTTIRAPIAGRVGLRLVDQGNLLRAGDATGIVTIAQLRPIAVTFTLPQQDLPRIIDAMRRGDVPVEARLQGNGAAPVQGRLLTIDNQVDAQTGTIRLKAVFENTDRRLWPGAFVTIRMVVETIPQAVVVPLVAVQRGPEGSFAFLLQEDETVQQRPLQLGVLTETLAVVTQGLRPGDRVVTSGALRLCPGARVAVMETPEGNGPPPTPGQRRRPRPQAESRP